MRDLKNIKLKLKELIGGEVVFNTDEYVIYRGIAKPEEVKEHRIVDHGKREWAKGDTHVDGCENRNGFLRAYLRRYRGCIKEILTGLP